MILLPQPQGENQILKFKLHGFPDESAVVLAVERFYIAAPQAPRSFEIDNTFEELIFTGSVTETGKLAQLDSKDRSEDRAKNKKD